MDDVEFTIQLFQVTEKNNHCIIVEMQRKNGSSIQFHTIARSILKAAKKQQQQQQQPLKQVNNRKRLVVRKNKSTTATSRGSNQEEVFACTLEMVDALLKKDRVDANLLGMESLQLLTTHQSASDAMVKYVSNCIITGDVFDNIKGTITSLIAKYTIDDDDDDESHSHRSNNNYVVDGYYQKMRICALAVLSNALKNTLPELKKNSSTTTKLDSIFSSDDWLNDRGGLLILLFNELQKDHDDNDNNEDATTKSNPKEAYLAATCLEQVLEHSSMMREYVTTKLDAKKIFQESMDVGNKSYPMLGSVCSRMLDLLSKGEE